MTVPKQAVKVWIGGDEYTVRSELPAEYTKEVAAYLDAALKRVREMLPTLDAQKAAVLAALAITDELFQARRGDRESTARMNQLVELLTPLVPPAKRASRATGALGSIE